LSNTELKESPARDSATDRLPSLPIIDTCSMIAGTPGFQSPAPASHAPDTNIDLITSHTHSTAYSR